jgi:alcohol dehydrogenase class IV
MVSPFQFARLPLIHFGPGKLSLLPGAVKKFGSAMILLTDGRSFESTSFASDLFNKFREIGIVWHHLTVDTEPSPYLVDSAVSGFMDEKIDAVVSIGGGSVIDAGKAISAMMYKWDTVTDYLEGVGTKDHPGTRLPFIALPTTSGTGSEATKNAVLSKTGKNGYKKSLRHDNFVPDIAIVDPSLTLTCPAEITAASGMDAFTQLTESFLSDKAGNYSDALAWEGLREIKTSLRESYMRGDSLRARTGMSFAALTSGICLANAGLGVVHGFASSIGGMFSIPHGIICGSLMAPANEVTVRELLKNRSNPGALDKYARLGRLFIDSSSKTDEYYIDGFLQYLQEITEELNIPRLDRYGISASDKEDICRLTELKNNPVKLSHESLLEILESRT